MENCFTQASRQQTPFSGTVTSTQDNVVPMGSIAAAQTAVFEQQNSATKDGDVEIAENVSNPLNDDFGNVDSNANHAIKDFDHSEETITNNIATVSQMQAVYDVPESSLEDTGKSIIEIYQDFFARWGGKLFSKELGIVDVKASSIRSERRHGNTAQKIASIEAIPTVVSKGKVIFANHKNGTDVLRIVVSAPITIAGKPYYMGVMIQRDSKYQRLYLHDVVIEEETPVSSEADLLTTGADEGDERLFISNILQRVLKVK